MKTDCFAYYVDGKGYGQCYILKKNVCAKKDCPFYKTNEQLKAEKLKCSKRWSKIKQLKGV